LHYSADIEQHRKKNTKAWQERVEVYEDLRWIYHGFAQLSSSRRMDGMGGVGGIAPTEVQAWLDLNDVRDQRRRGEFVALVGAMDAEFMSFAVSRKAGSDGTQGRTATGDRRARDDQGRRRG